MEAPSDAVDWLREVRHSRAVLTRPADNAVKTVVIAHAAGGQPMRLGLDAAGGAHLLVGVGGPDPREANGRSLDIKTCAYAFDDTPGYYLDLACREPDLQDLFDELLAALIPRLHDAEDPYDAVVRSLARWRELLRGRADVLTHQREMGLLAELYVLNEVARGATFDPTWWRGPLREPKDVVMPNAWIEVKAVSPAADSVRINGLAQLEDLPGLDGFLCVVDVDLDDDGAGLTCIELAESVAVRATDREVFEALLVKSQLPAGEPVPRTWRVGAVTLCPVSTVPRLVPAMFTEAVPAGVRTVTYELDRHLLGSLSLPHPRSVLAGLAGSR